jgi:hypothetical protein
MIDRECIGHNIEDQESGCGNIRSTKTKAWSRYYEPSTGKTRPDRGE